MKNWQTTYSLRPALTMFVLLASCLVWTARGERSDQIARSFEVHPGGKLVLNADRGSITISTHAVAQVSVTIQREVKGGSDEEAQRVLDEHEITFDQEGETVHVTGDGPPLNKKGGFFGWFKRGNMNLQVKYELVVPAQFDVDLLTAGGGIRISDLVGRMDARTSGGSIKISDGKGPMGLRTSGGSIELADCHGAVEARTSGGSIRLNQIQGDADLRTSGGSIHLKKSNGAMVAKTSGGRIEVEALSGTLQGNTSGGSISAHFVSPPRGDCQLRTSGGSITVCVPPQADLYIDAQTSGGGVKSELPVTVSGEIKKSQLKGRLNQGGPQMHLRTSGGSIHIKSN